MKTDLFQRETIASPRYSWHINPVLSMRNSFRHQRVVMALRSGIALQGMMPLHHGVSLVSLK